LRNNVTAADLWESTVAKFPNKIGIIFEGKQLTFRQIDEGFFFQKKKRF